MKIKHDYSYLGSGKELIDRGYAELDIHSITFEGAYDKLVEIQNCINSNEYEIYNITENLSYNDDWDFYYYSNKGWNNKDTFDFFQLNPNDNRETSSNSLLINELLDNLERQLKHLKDSDVRCRIQYTTRVKEDLLKSKGMKLKRKLVGKTIDYQGHKGKIRRLKGEDDYGFFKLRAKTKYYPIPNEYLVLNYEKLLKQDF